MCGCPCHCGFPSIPPDTVELYYIISSSNDSLYPCPAYISVCNKLNEASACTAFVYSFVRCRQLSSLILPSTFVCFSLDEESTKLSSISVILSSAFRPLHCWIIITKSDQSRLERRTHTNTDQVFQGDDDDDDDNN